MQISIIKQTASCQLVFVKYSKTLDYLLKVLSRLQGRSLFWKGKRYLIKSIKTSHKVGNRYRAEIYAVQEPPLSVFNIEELDVQFIADVYQKVPKASRHMLHNPTFIEPIVIESTL